MYLLYGLEKYLIDERIKKIIQENNIENIDINRYNLENSTIDEIIEDASIISMFQDKKMIIVDNAYIFTSSTNKKLPEQNIDLLTKYLNSNNSNTILIFVVLKDKIDTRKKITTLFKNVGKIEEYNLTNDISKIVINLFKPYQINNKNVNLLINRVGNNLSLLSSEIEKIKI